MNRREFLRDVLLWSAGLTVAVPSLTLAEVLAAPPPAPLVVVGTGTDYPQLVARVLAAAGGMGNYVRPGARVICDRSTVSDMIRYGVNGLICLSKDDLQQQLDTLRSMVEPKVQGPSGVQTLASLGFGSTRAFQRNVTASVLLLVWGSHVLPIFLESVEVGETAHLPTLVPYRATVKLSVQVIEGNNPFYTVEKVRQVVGAALNTGRTAVSAIGGLF